MVTFYKIKSDGTHDVPVLYLDTLKVSTIEQTASSADAKGGKGNPTLISWDFGKEITLNIEDALFSPKSMALMFGDGNVGSYLNDSTTSSDYIEKTANMILSAAVPDASATAESPTINIMVKKDNSTSASLADVKVLKAEQESTGSTYAWKLHADEANNVEIIGIYDETGTEITEYTSSKLVAGRYMVMYKQKISASVIHVDASNFPGTYYVTGDKLRNCLLAA